MATEVKAQVKWTADQLDVMLRQIYQAPRYGYLSEVREGTGYSKSGSCDGLAMNLWPSDGLDLIGFEIKVSRSDWIREIQNPMKSEAFSKFCSWWYIVATPGVVKIEELPALWGLMEPVGDKLKYRRPATKRPDIVSPDRLLLAAIMRKVIQESVSQSIIEKTRAEAYREGKEQGVREEQYRHQNNHYTELFKTVETFEKQSGVSLQSWDSGNIGETVRYVREWNSLKEDLPYRKKKLEEAVKAIEELLK